MAIRSEPQWERRRDGEASAEYLGRVLEDYCRLPEMATKARACHYDDYFCPPEVADGMETTRLVRDLDAEAIRFRALGDRNAARRIEEVNHWVKRGEFDGTKEESDRWAASPDGREAFRKLVDGE